MPILAMFGWEPNVPPNTPLGRRFDPNWEDARDAQSFARALPQRLAKFSLTTSVDKSGYRAQLPPHFLNQSIG